MKELVEFIVKNLVSDADSVQVVEEVKDRETVYTVKIAGSSKFSQLIEFGIETNEMTKYNERKIKVEVI